MSYPASSDTAGLRSQASPIIVGTLVAQMLGVALLPVVMRVVDPRPFAEYSSILAASMVLGSIASMRLEALLPQHPSDQRPEIERVSYGLSAAICTLVSALILCFTGLLFSSIAIQQALGIGAIGWLTSAIGIRTYSAVARGDGKRPGSAKVAQALVLPALQIGLILGGLRQLVGLLFAEVASRVAAERTMSFGLGRNRYPRSVRLLALEVRGILQRHRRHIVTFAPATLVNLGASQLPLMIAPIVLSAGAGGIYALGHRLILIPSTLISQGLGQAFHHQFGRAAMDQSSASLRDTVQMLHRRIGVIVGVIFAAVAAVAPALLSAVAPPEWVSVGVVISLLAVWASALTVASPFSSLLVISGRQVESLTLNAIDLVSKGAIGLVLAAVPGADATTFAVAVSSFATVVAITSGFRFLAAAGCSARSTLPGTLIAVGLPLLSTVLVMSVRG